MIKACGSCEAITGWTRGKLSWLHRRCRNECWRLRRRFSILLTATTIGIFWRSGAANRHFREAHRYNRYKRTHFVSDKRDARQKRYNGYECFWPLNRCDLECRQITFSMLAHCWRGNLSLPRGRLRSASQFTNESCGTDDRPSLGPTESTLSQKLDIRPPPAAANSDVQVQFTRRSAATLGRLTNGRLTIRQGSLRRQLRTPPIRLRR